MSTLAPLDAVDELAGEPALADARLAVDREEVRAPVAQRCGRTCSRAARARLPPDERRATPTGRGSGLRACPRRATRGAARRCPSSSSGPASSTTSRPRSEAVRGRADQDLARRRRLLEARGEVDGLAGREGRVGVVDDDLARLDADPRLEPELVRPRRGWRAPPGPPARRRPRAPAGRRTRPSRRRRRTSRRCRRAASTHWETCSKNCVTRRRTTSGSVPVTSRVESTRSTNRTVASFRSTCEV